MDNKYLSQDERKSMRNRKIFTWAGVAILLAGSVFGIYSLSKTDKGAVLGTDITFSDHKTGPDDAKVKIVEYSDFQCPACAAYDVYVDLLLAEYKDRVQLVYRHFPLTSIHKNSVTAASASEAAALQGKFFEMADLLFQKQSEWSSLSDPKPMFISFASSLGLDTSKFTSDMNDQSVKDKILNDEQEAMKMGLNSTPTFFINNQKVATPADYEGFKSLIETELNK